MSTFLQGCKKQPPALFMPLILPEEGFMCLPFSILNQDQFTIILQSCRPSCTEHLHPFLGKGFISIRQVLNCPNRIIFKPDLYGHIILMIPPTIRQSPGANCNRSSVHQVGDKVNKMTAFTNDPPAPLLWVMQPMREGQIPGINPVGCNQGFLAILQELFQCHPISRKSAVETNH